MQPADLTILQVSPNDEGGGAERVALDLHRSYLDRGYDAWLALGASHGHVPNSLAIQNTRYRDLWARTILAGAGLADPARPSALPRSLQRTARLVAEPSRYRRVAAGLEDFDSPGTAHLLELPPRRPNLLHLHNLHGSYFDIRELPSLSARVPTIATLHDVWLLTGHCAHPIDCERWLGGCATCPALDRYVPIRADASCKNFEIKREALRRSALRLAVPSRWLADLVERSGIAGSLVDLRVIPNGVDPAIFRPGDRDAARAELGLSLSATVLMFAARGGRTSPFKGFDTLEAALPRIASGSPEREIVMVAVGEGAREGNVGGISVISVPFTSDSAVMARYYQGADVYVHPSRAENFPLTLLEAMACGLPVVASDVGGIPEVVLDGGTGLLVPPDDPAALASATLSLLMDDARRASFSAAGIRRGREFTLDRQVASYLDWYSEIASLQPPSTSSTVAGAR
jgi:glycosyltransferase involved in cell wall biosynthesis